MKRALSLALAFIMAAGLLAFLPRHAVATETKDQSYEEMSGVQWEAWESGSFKQTFKPSVDRITSFSVYVANKSSVLGAAGVRLLSNGNKLECKNSDRACLMDMDRGGSGRSLNPYEEKWISYGLNEGYYFTVDPGKEYTLEVKGDGFYTGNYSEGGGFSIAYNNKNGYANGSFEQKPGYDMLFRVYGYNTSSGGGASGGSGSTKKSTPVAGVTQAEVAQGIPTPVLKEVKKNDEKIEVATDKEIEISSNDSLDIAGTLPAGSDAVMFVGETGFMDTANIEGIWEISFDGKSIKEGTHVVQVQNQTEDGKGSEMVDLFKLKKAADEKPVAVAAENTPWWEKVLGGKYFWYIMGGLLLLLIGGVAFLAHRITKRKMS